MHVTAIYREAQGTLALREGFAKVRRAVLRVPTDTVIRFRSLWSLLVFGIALVLIAVGGGYAYGGEKSTYSREPFRVILILTRTLEAHGCIMLFLGLGLFFSLGSLLQAFNKRAMLVARVFLALTVVYSVWCAYGFAAAYFLNHHYTPAMFWYIATATSAFGLLFFTPPIKTTPMSATGAERA